MLVEEKRISAVGPADELEVPGGAKIIEGNGAYLMPGLADMHMHLTFDPIQIVTVLFGSWRHNYSQFQRHPRTF